MSERERTECQRDRERESCHSMSDERAGEREIERELSLNTAVTPY